MIQKHLKQYDKKLGGWGSVHKFLFGDSEELALREAWLGNKEEEAMAKKTLTSALSILDPVWGGAYQYSVDTWKEPHFEKIAETQMKNLFLYSLGYSLLDDAKYLDAASGIRHYLTTFLKNEEGAFYTSQDADLVRGVHSAGYFKLKDQERRKKGIPTIDKHIYARENGWFISGLLALYAAQPSNEVLDDAIRSIRWIEKHRSLSLGGFSHDEKDAAGPYLGDTLEMGIAYVAFYQNTGERTWLDKAKAAAGFIKKHFESKTGGYFTSTIPIAAGLPINLIKDENIRVVRFTNLLSHYTGNENYKKMAETAMRYLATPSFASQTPTAGVLLAEKELSERPVHLTIVGSKKDPDAQKLFSQAIRYPVSYKRVDFWDKEEGQLPNPDVQYPTLKKAAAFACKEGRCSFPITNPAEFRAKVDQLYK